MNVLSGGGLVLTNEDKVDPMASHSICGGHGET
jgi:hypothetical protein